MKVCAPLPAHYILNGTTFITSHHYSPLHVYEFLDYFAKKNKEIDDTLTKDKLGNTIFHRGLTTTVLDQVILIESACTAMWKDIH